MNRWPRAGEQRGRTITGCAGLCRPPGYDSRRLLDRDVVDMRAKQHPGRVITPVREAVAARDAYTSGMPVSVFAPGSGIAADYSAAIAPIIGMTEPVDTSTEQQATV